MFQFRKADGGLTIIIIVIVIVIFLGWLINLGSKECRNNTQCGNGFYCGSDFSCHEMPVIEKTTVKNNLILPSIIIGIAIVIGAFIMKNGKLPFLKKSDEFEEEKTEFRKNKLRAP